MGLAAKVQHVVKHGAAGLKRAVTATNGFEGVTGGDGIGHGLHQGEHAAAVGFDLDLKASIGTCQPFHQSRRTSWKFDILLDGYYKYKKEMGD